MLVDDNNNVDWWSVGWLLVLTLVDDDDYGWWCMMLFDDNDDEGVVGGHFYLCRFGVTRLRRWSKVPCKPKIVSTTPLPPTHTKKYELAQPSLSVQKCFMVQISVIFHRIMN